MTGIAVAFAVACVLTGVRPAGSLEPQGEAEPTIEQELAALIEKTNALESFHVVYSMESTVEGAPSGMSMEVDYEAPARGRLLVSTDDGEQDMWIDGDRMYMCTAGVWRKAELPTFRTCRVLDELFPRASDTLAPGVMLDLRLERKGDGIAFQIDLATALVDRSVVLGWLGKMRRDRSNVTVEGETLVWSGEGTRVTISRSSGFIEGIDVSTPRGESQVRSRSLRIDEALGQSVSVPREAREVDTDAEFTRQLQARLLEDLRNAAFGRICARIDRGDSEWAGRTVVDWRSLLEVLHQERMDHRYAQWLEGVREGVRQRAESLREARGNDRSADALERLRRSAAEARVSLEETLDREETKYLESLSKGPDDLRQDMLDIEEAVVRERYDEVVRQPILTLYDEETKAALGE
jgi:hypothetical protein